MNNPDGNITRLNIRNGNERSNYHQLGEDENYYNSSDNSTQRFIKSIKFCFPGISIKTVTFYLILTMILIFSAMNLFYYQKISHNKEVIDKISTGNFKELNDHIKLQFNDVTWSCILYKFGSSFPPAILRGKELYRLLTSTILHANISHISGNLISILFISFYCAFIYLASGFFGNILSGILQPSTQGVGASGCIFGLYGFLILIFVFHSKQMSGQRKTIFFYFLLSFIFNFISSFNDYKTSNVGVFAHLGGFITGIVIGFYYLDLRENHLLLSDVTLGRLCIIQRLLILIYFLMLACCCYFYYKMKITDDFLKESCTNIFSLASGK